MSKGALAARLIDQGVGKIEYVLTLVSGLALGVVLLSISVDVIGRSFRLLSLPWTVEFAQYWLIAGTFLSAGWLHREHVHPRVSALDGIKRPVIHRAVVITGSLLAVAACVFGLFFAIEIVSTQFARGAGVGVFVRLPRWIVLSPLPLGFAFLLYESIAMFIRGPVNSASRPEPSVSAPERISPR